MKNTGIRPNFITDLPDYKVEKKLSFPDLKGGLNLSAPDTEIKANESPEMQNLCFFEGTLNCRDGQYFVDSAEKGTFHACLPELWHGALFAHLGTDLCLRTVYYSVGNDTVTLGDWYTLRSGIGENPGTFFLYQGYLFYKTKGLFVQITATQISARYWNFTQQLVTAYTPVIQINTTPTTAAGDLYQSENRYGADKTVWYNADGGKLYKLPVVATRVSKVVVDGAQLTSGWTYNASTGIVTFTSAPPVTTPATNNTVRITYTLANTEAYNSIDECNLATVYGGSNGLCIVLSGYEKQKNAYFWNGNSSTGMEIGYFPMDQYQLAGNAAEAITGFGHQQAQLVVFKADSVGKVEPSTVTVNDRDFISMVYTPINAKLGCNLPGSIQLIENYLVWAHTKWGCMMLKDTSEANENNIEIISRKINRGESKGLVYDLERAASDDVCSFDDGKRYCLSLGDHAYAWDYSISTASSPSWFFYTAIAARGYVQYANLTMHLNSVGQLSRFARVFSDYGQAIEKVYRFAGRFFDTYDSLKNIDRVEIAMRCDTNTETELTYITDDETRKELKNLTFSSTSRFPVIFIRKPYCRHVRHFSMKLTNHQAKQNMSIAKADIYYNLQGKDRGFL